MALDFVPLFVAVGLGAFFGTSALLKYRNFNYTQCVNVYRITAPVVLHTSLQDSTLWDLVMGVK